MTKFIIYVKYRNLLWRIKRKLSKFFFVNKYKIAKKVIYTVLIDDYDILPPILCKTNNWDYICFTNRSDLFSNDWEIILLPEEFLNPFRYNRKYKILNHLLLLDYDLSIYIDANIQIIGNLNKFIYLYLPKKADIAMMEHYERSTIKEEAEACIKDNKDNENIVRNQIEEYTKSKFPDIYILTSNRTIVRKHNKKVYNLMENWWSEIEKHSSRDQLSFNYVLWKNPKINISLFKRYEANFFFKKLQHNNN